ncbi:MAG: hypothetical protein R2756_15615 [Bacteroidales bacterium]
MDRVIKTRGAVSTNTAAVMTCTAAYIAAKTTIVTENSTGTAA